MSVVARGLKFPEGQILLGDGSVAFTQQAGTVCRFDGGAVEVIANVGGGPNSCCLGGDGSIYICQNGGVVGSWRSSDPRSPGIQRITADGRVSSTATQIGSRRLIAPNDLAFGADGALYFTDPAQPFDPKDPIDLGGIYRLGSEGGTLVAE